MNKNEWDKHESAYHKVDQTNNLNINYLQEPPILKPPVPGRPLIMHLTVLDESMGCVLGQHDDTSRKKHAIYYLSKKFTELVKFLLFFIYS